MRSNWLVGTQSGLALVMTLLIISFLVAITMQLMITTDRQVAMSAAQREQVRLDGMVLGGLNLARAALLADQDENNFESVHDSWALFDQEALKALAGDIELTVSITDLSGRLQVNALGASGPGKNPGGSQQKGAQEKENYRAIWLRLLKSGKFAIADDDQAEALLAALSDWVDKDDNERDQGAEESYYRSLESAYGCRNGDISQVSELLLVKGMTTEILFGDKEHEGLINYITIAGEDGKINMNTAPLLVLQALSAEMTDELAQELIDFRADVRNREALASTNWYKQVSGLSGDITFDSNVLTVTGTYFQIQSKAIRAPFMRTGTALLKRTENKGQEIMLWHVQ